VADPALRPALLVDLEQHDLDGLLRTSHRLGHGVGDACDERALLFGGELANRFRGDCISVVIGPALGGVVIAFAVANGLEGSRAIFAERQEGLFSLRRGFEIRKGEKVLVVEDVITTGGSIREVIAMVKSFQAEVCSVAAVAERSSQPMDFGVRKEVLLQLPLTTFPPDDCLLCRQQIPLVKPGSRTFSKGG